VGGDGDVFDRGGQTVWFERGCKHGRFEKSCERVNYRALRRMRAHGRDERVSETVSFGHCRGQRFVGNVTVTRNRTGNGCSERSVKLFSDGPHMRGGGMRTIGNRLALSCKLEGHEQKEEKNSEAVHVSGEQAAGIQHPRDVLWGLSGKLRPEAVEAWDVEQRRLGRVQLAVWGQRKGHAVEERGRDRGSAGRGERELPGMKKGGRLANLKAKSETGGFGDTVSVVGGQGK
jgi:hypothetical protein